MNKLRIVYIASLVVFVSLIAFIGYSLFRQANPEDGPGTDVSYGLIERNDYSIIQFIISNKEGRELHYMIRAYIDENTLWDVSFPIKPGRTFQYRRPIYRGDREKVVNILIYRMGEEGVIYETGEFAERIHEQELIENVTYSIKAK
ncbi:MAG: hypothetical protein V3T58_01720 [Candidatus Hydrothermarchaeales archaeon]